MISNSRIEPAAIITVDEIGLFVYGLVVVSAVWAFYFNASVSIRLKSTLRISNYGSYAMNASDAIPRCRVVFAGRFMDCCRVWELK